MKRRFVEFQEQWNVTEFQQLNRVYRTRLGNVTSMLDNNRKTSGLPSVICQNKCLRGFLFGMQAVNSRHAC